MTNIARSLYLAALLIGCSLCPAVADDCKKIPMWLAYVGQKAAESNATPHVIAQKEGDEAKRLVAAFNAAPPSTDIHADQFIVVAFMDTASGQPLFAYAGFFVNGCLTSSGRLHNEDAVRLISGQWQPGQDS